MINERLLPQPGQAGAAPNTFASENFNTVLYTGTGASQRIGGYINRGAVFNGSAYITTGYKAVSSTAASISFWVNITAYTYYGGFVGDSTGQSSASRFFLGQGANNGTLWVSLGNGSTQWYDDTTVSLSSYGLNNWFHLVGTADGTTVKIYINGSLIHTFTSSISYAGAGTGPYYLGGWGNSLRLNGKLDQVRFFNKALSSSEVTTLYGETFASTTISTTDIFNDNSGVALYQLDGNANDTGGVSGKFGSGAIFNGSSSIIKNTSLGTDYRGQTTLSLSAWFKTSASSGRMTIVSFSATGDGSTDLFLGLDTNTVGFRNISDGTSQVQAENISGTSVRDGDWHHVVFTADSNGNKLYVDGSQITVNYDTGSSSTTLVMPSDLNQFNIGGNQDSGGNQWYWDGIIDEVRIYSDVLTLDEVGYIYNNTTASIPTDNLEAYYKLNGDARDEQQLYDGAASNVTYAYDGTASNVTYQEATKFSPDLVWIKKRSSSTSSDHVLNDSIRGANKILYPNLSNGEDTAGGAGSAYFNSFDSNGFTVGSSTYYNGSGETYVAWCFNAGANAAASNTDGTITSTVKANTDAGFSIVSYTGNGSVSQTVGHGLSSAPEFVLIKNRTSSSNDWQAFGGSIFSRMQLNNTGSDDGNYPLTFSATTFTLPNLVTSEWNTSSSNYIAYCFHSVDGYQKIGSYTGTGASGNMVETGFEPAFILFKRTDSGDRWIMADNKRADALTNMDDFLDAQDSAQEGSFGATNGINFLSNGFSINTTDGVLNASGGAYIYLAIAADPDTTTPTVENSFDVVTYTGNDSSQDIETDFKPDLVWIKRRTSSEPHAIYDSIRGINKQLSSDSTGAEATNSSPYEGFTAFNDNGFTVGNNGGTNRAPNDYVAWCWKAGDNDENLPQINTEGSIDSIVSVNDAAGFSIVKYTGTGSDATIGHGLSSAPQIIFVKRLDTSAEWVVGETVANDFTKVLHLDTTAAASSATYFNNTDPTSTVFSVRGASGATGGAGNFIAYCWYSVTGHSKIGSYVGTGGSISAIDVGFEPRFVMIKSTGNTSGSWAILDNLREGTSKHQLSANGSHAEYDNQGVTFTSTGFSPRQSLSSDTNTSSVTYIYMAFK